MSTTNHGEYFIPEPSKWPIVGTIALTTTVIGAVNTIHSMSAGGSMSLLLPVGLLLIAYLFFGWFGAVIDESMAGQLQRTGRSLIPYRHVVVHLLRSDVLCRLLRRPVLCTRLICRLARRRR